MERLNSEPLRPPASTAVIFDCASRIKGADKQMTKDEITYLACVAKLGCYACRVYGGHTTKAKARATSSPFLAVPLCDEHSATL